MHRHRLVSAISLVVLLSLVLVTVPQPTTAKFVLAWPDPLDENGQGFGSLYAYENSTGSFVPHPESPFYGSESPISVWNHTPNTAIRLIPVCYVNITYLGYTINEALDNMRVNLTIYVEGVIVYQQNDLANSSHAETIPLDGTWYVGYQIDLPIIIQPVTYTVVMSYEIYM